MMGGWFNNIDLTRYSWGSIGHAEGWGFAAKTGESSESEPGRLGILDLVSKNVSISSDWKNMFRWLVFRGKRA